MSSQATALAAREVTPSRQSAPEGRPDPRRIALHRALRAAIVNPAVFAVALLVIHNLQVATFAVFGCFALLVMADFGGHRPARAVAYVAATVAGAGLVALGTAVSPDAAVGALVMVVVGFTLAFTGVFGGYLAAAQTAMLLAFVLAVSIPAPVAAIPTRVEGWVFAGLVSTLAGVFFWPWFERVNLRARAADACLAVATRSRLCATAARTLSWDGFERRRAPRCARCAANTHAPPCARLDRRVATVHSWS